MESMLTLTKTLLYSYLRTRRREEHELQILVYLLPSISAAARELAAQLRWIRSRYHYSQESSSPWE